MLCERQKNQTANIKLFHELHFDRHRNISKFIFIFDFLSVLQREFFENIHRRKVKIDNDEIH